MHRLAHLVCQVLAFFSRLTDLIKKIGCSRSAPPPQNYQHRGTITLWKYDQDYHQFCLDYHPDNQHRGTITLWKDRGRSKKPGKKTQTALRSHHSQNYDEHPVDLFPKKLTFADSQVFAVAGIKVLINPKIFTKYEGILLYKFVAWLFHLAKIVFSFAQVDGDTPAFCKWLKRSKQTTFMSKGIFVQRS